MRNRQHHRTPWTAEQVEQLRQLILGHQPAGVIANQLGRTVEAIILKAKLEGFALNSAERRRSG